MATKSDICQLWLTCADQAEADRIANSLLVKQLVGCSRSLPIKSSFRWRGKIEQSEEILLVMESKSDLFEEIESEVAKLHSYETFVLEAVPVSRLSARAASWLDKELK